jgi:hypothetical protein
MWFFYTKIISFSNTYKKNKIMLKNKLVIATLTTCTLLTTIKSSAIIPPNTTNITIETKQSKSDNLPYSVINKIYQATRSDYAGNVRKIVKFERTPYPFYCDDIREGRTQPITCDPPNIKDTWKIVADTYFERLVYYIQDTGKIKLASREYLAKPNKIPSRIQQAVLQDAYKNWALPKNTVKIVSVRETLQPSGADFTALPVEPRFEGQTSKAPFWEIVMEHNQTQWIYYVDNKNPNKLELWSRLNYAKQAKLPVNVALELIARASANLNVIGGQALITSVENREFGGCFDLAAPWEKCQKARIKGYRVTVQGKNGNQVTYRTAGKSNYIVMEGAKNMPPRTDALYNTLAEKIIKDAGNRLKSLPTNLRITSVETSNECISAIPQVNGKCQVKVHVTNGKKQLSYTLDRTRQNFTAVAIK